MKRITDYASVTSHTQLCSVDHVVNCPVQHTYKRWVLKISQHGQQKIHQEMR